MKPICLIDKDKGLRDGFNWKNTQPLLEKNCQQKGTKFNFLDYQLQSIKAHQFLQLNEEGPNQNSIDEKYSQPPRKNYTTKKLT